MVFFADEETFDEGFFVEAEVVVDFGGIVKGRWRDGERRERMEERRDGQRLRAESDQ